MIESDNNNPWEVVSKAPPGIWCEISEAQMMEALEVLPPIYFPGGFAVSEPLRHDGNGDPVYLCVVTIGEQYWVVEATIARARREVRNPHFKRDRWLDDIAGGAAQTEVES